MSKKKLIISLVLIIVLLIIGSVFKWFQEPVRQTELIYNSASDHVLWSRDEAIITYLLSQKDFAWQTEATSQNDCVFENLGSEDDLFPLSLWVYCQEYKIENEKLITLSGVSGPVLINYPNELSYFSLENFSHQIPRDGSFYGKDIKDIFSSQISNKILKHVNVDELQKRFKQRVLEHYQQDIINNQPIDEGGALG